MRTNTKKIYAGGINTPSHIGLNRDKGVALARTLYNAYMNRKFIYAVQNTTTAPQNVFKPTDNSILKNSSYQKELSDEDGVMFLSLLRATENENTGINHLRPGSKEERCWHFFSTGTDRRQVSNNVYRTHAALYRKYPELYSKDVTLLTKDRLEEILRAEKMGIPSQSAEFWLCCAKTLFEDFDGDPVNIFKACGGTVNGVLAFKDSKKDDPLKGYGPKITSLLALFLSEIGAMPFPDDAFAVDMHVQRLFQHVGALEFFETRTNEELEKELRPFLCETRLANNMEPISMAHSFWLLGRSGCTRCYARRDAQILCPVWDKCGGLIDAKEYFRTRTWGPTNAPRLRKGGERTLKHCDGPLILK